MRDRGKAVESSIDSFSSDPLCRKHPSSSSVGICAYCLKDRLIKLVCSDCGEQRLSSCSCSDISNRNSCSAEVGSVGRISFLIENAKTEGATAESGSRSKPSLRHSSSNSKSNCAEKVEATAAAAAAASVLLKRNCSSSVYEKRRAFWHFGWFFRKKKELGHRDEGRNSSGLGEEGEILSNDHLGSSGSRPAVGLDEPEGSTSGKQSGFPMLDSLNRGSASGKKCGFPMLGSLNGDVFTDPEDGFRGKMRTGFAGVKKSGLDVEKEAGFIDLNISPESNGRFSVLKSGGFLGSETGFGGGKEAGFIDLEVGSSTKSKGGGLSGLKSRSLVDTESDFGNVRSSNLSSIERGSFSSIKCCSMEHETDIKKFDDFSTLQGNGFGSLRRGTLEHESGSFEQLRSGISLSSASSCRITVNDCDTGIGGKKGKKVWKWIFKNSKGSSGRK